MLNQFFGQKPQQPQERQQEDPKNQPNAAQERAGGEVVSEQRFNIFKNSLSRTRQLFNRMGDNFKQDDITDDLWDDLEEALLSADVGPVPVMADYASA